MSILPDELVQAILLEGAPPIGIYVVTVVEARGLTVDRDAKANRVTIRSTRQYEMKIAGVKSIANNAGYMI